MDNLPKVAAARKTEPAQLSKLVRGEIDWIVMKCLEKDRSRRYDTASALARDLERYLQGEPVEASPPSRFYRLRKYAQRHWLAIATLTGFAGLLVAGSAVSVWQALRATRAEREAIAARDSAAVYRDLLLNDPKVRAAYGETPFGNGCLLARRLVQAGVTFVEVRSNGWDTHQQSAEKVGKNASSVDPGFASLVADLKAKGMLEKTLVIWMGEFGRTPKINPNAGRDHFPRVFNVAVAGGGVKGGQVIGSSSAEGTEVKDNPVAVNDLLTSICHTLKIDPAKENMSSLGRPIKIVDGGKVVTQLFS